MICVLMLVGLVPATASATDDGFYVVGTMNNWTVDPAYKMSQQYADGNYYFDCTLDAGTEFKVRQVQGGVETTWIPGGANLTAPGGAVRIFCNPNDNWVGVTEIVNGRGMELGSCYLLGALTNWQAESDYEFYIDSENEFGINYKLGPMVMDATGEWKACYRDMYGTEHWSQGDNKTILASNTVNVQCFYSYSDNAITAFYPYSNGRCIITHDETNVFNVEVSPGRMELKAGDEISLQVIPNEGYQVVSLDIGQWDYGEGTMVNPESILDSFSNGAYHFIMPDYDVGYNAVCEQLGGYYLVFEGNETPNSALKFSANSGDEAPYILSGISLAQGDSVRVDQFDASGNVVASFPSDSFYTVGAAYASDDDDINVRFDTTAHTTDTETLNWTQFGGYFAWEAYENVVIWTGALYGVTVDSAIANGTVSFTTESGETTQAHEGETVTITATPDSGYELARLTVMQGETAVAVAADNTFTMPGGSVTISAAFRRNDTPVLQSVNLHDEGRIGITFKLTLPSGVNASDVSVELSVGGTVTTPALGAPDNNGVYSVSTSLPARKMDAPIILKTKVGSEYRLQGSMGTDFSQDGYSTSISACCDSYMARYENGSAVYNLAEAMKIYGTNAHAYLDHVGSTIKTFEDFDDYSLEINDMPAGITLTSVYLTLKDNTDLNLRFTLADGYSADDFTFYCDVRGDLTPTVSGSTATVKIAGIPAAELGDGLMLYIDRDDGETGWIRCAPLYYGKLAMQTDDEALQDVVGALANYSGAAYYFWATQG